MQQPRMDRKTFVRTAISTLAPLRYSAAKTIIYRLNTLHADLRYTPYRYGFPQPAQVLKDLKGVTGHCQAAVANGDCTRLRRRVEELRQNDTGSYGLLLFEAALALRGEAPESAIEDGSAWAHLVFAAEHSPTEVLEWARQATGLLADRKQEGRGGDRYRGKPQDRDLVHDLGILYEAATGRPPTYSGPFRDFCIAVFRGLGYFIDEKKIKRNLASIKCTDEPRWKTR